MSNKQFAEIIFLNAKVYTVDEHNPTAEAVAVQDKRIAYVGDNAGAAQWQGPETQVIDAAGRTLMPGFIDSHFHLLMGSEKLEDLDLDPAYTRSEVAQLLGAWAEAHPHLTWIEGVQAHYAAMNGDEDAEPVRKFLDNIVADRPVYISAFDGHTSWANTLALELGGILHGAEVPPGNVIVTDPVTGMATGELREPAAMDPVRRLMPQPDADAKRKLLKKGMALAASLGITSVHNMDGNDERLALYQGLEAEGEMTLRIYVPWDIKPHTPIEDIAQAAAWKATHQNEYVRTGCVKVFMDGVLESYTALMIDDYAGAPGNKGEALHSAERFKRIAQTADALGLQIFVHCCGDGAVQRALDGYAHAQQVNGKRDSRHRIEHIEVIYPPDIPRFAELDVIGSMQPLHWPPGVNPTDAWPAHAGAQRWKYSFAWKTLREAGMRHAFGSDWPVVSMDPILGIWSGLNRKPMLPGDPEQAQTLQQLIAGYTRDGAYAEFMEHEKGMVRTGMLADLVLLSEDIFAVPSEEFRRVKVDMTLCNGRVVFTRSA